MPRNLGDVAKVFAEDLGDVPRVVCAMGAQGFATRALASRFGSLWTYASVGGLGSIGHVTPHELVRDFRFRSVSQSAALYGVTGWPLKKTRSPELHNAAFLNEDADALMIPFPAKTAKEAFAFMKAMGMRGMAVTIPHKFAIMPLLDKIDKFAQKVGAVNTVVCEKGKYVGYNTDVEGFAEALSSFAGTLSGKTAEVQGVSPRNAAAGVRHTRQRDAGRPDSGLQVYRPRTRLRSSLCSRSDAAYGPRGQSGMPRRERLFHASRAGPRPAEAFYCITVAI